MKEQIESLLMNLREQERYLHGQLLMTRGGVQALESLLAEEEEDEDDTTA